MHGCEVERVYCLVVFGAFPGQRSSKHWMSSSELSESQAVITPRSPTHSRQLTTPVTLEWCVCTYGFVTQRKREDWKGERKLKTRSIRACSKYASCVTAKSECTDKHAVIVWVQWVSESCECVRRGEKRRVYFFSPLFLPPSLHVSPVSHPSIFHFYTQLQMWRQWNIKLQKWACICTLATSKTTQTLLSPDLTHTFSHVEYHSWKCRETHTTGERSKSILGTYWLQVCCSSAVWLCVCVKSTHTLNESQVAITTAGCLGALMCSPCTGH